MLGASDAAAPRHGETGLRKRADREATWEEQRAEDAIYAELRARRTARWRSWLRRSTGLSSDAKCNLFGTPKTPKPCPRGRYGSFGRADAEEEFARN